MPLMNYMEKLMIKKMFIYLINFYRYFLSFFIAPCCRFHPTCSAYAAATIEKHGLMRGLYYTINRLLKCHPYNHGQYFDPIP